MQVVPRPLSNERRIGCDGLGITAGYEVGDRSDLISGPILSHTCSKRPPVLHTYQHADHGTVCRRVANSRVVRRIRTTGKISMIRRLHTLTCLPLAVVGDNRVAKCTTRVLLPVALMLFSLRRVSVCLFVDEVEAYLTRSQQTVGPVSRADTTPSFAHTAGVDG